MGDGHQITLLTNECWRQKFNELKAENESLCEFVPVGSPFDLSKVAATFPNLADNEHCWTDIWQKLVVPDSVEFYEKSVQTIGELGVDVAVSHYLCPSVRNVEIPVVRGSPFPLCWKETWDYAKWSAKWCVFNGSRDGFITLGMWSKHYRDWNPNDPRGAVVSGWPLYDHPVHVAQNDLPEQGKAIAISFGSVAKDYLGFGPNSLIHKAILACENSGFIPLLFGVEGVNHMAECIPLRLLPSYLPRCAALIHHGSCGSIGMAMRAGVPMVNLPMAIDHFSSSAFADDAGVSETLPAEFSNERRIADAIESTIKFHAKKAVELGSLVRAENGAKQCLDAILSLA